MHYHTIAAAEKHWGYNYVPMRRQRVEASEALESAVMRLAAGSAVVIFRLSSCCMCHAEKRLFCGIGVNPTVYELDQCPGGREIEQALRSLLGGLPNVPLVFVGGNMLGAVDSVMASHINGTLVPVLKEAGALWL